MNEIEDRRQRARVAYYDGVPRGAREGSAIALETAIETATRVQVTDDIVDAAHYAQGGDLGADSKAMVIAAFRAAGFEVEE